MATDEERRLLQQRILPDIGRTADTFENPHERLTGFLAMKGAKYEGELMVVGRAVNGWRDDVIEPRSPRELANSDTAAAFAQQVMASVNDEPCPMCWVTSLWGTRSGYNTARSAFWRCIRKVVSRFDVADVDRDDWPSVLTWSNLLKVAPQAGGNPGGLLATVQFPGCVELFRLELSIYQPRRVLMLTGFEWALGFVDGALLRIPDSPKYVQAVADIGQTRFVIAVHPQGKRESEWVDAVGDAFAASV